MRPEYEALVLMLSTVTGFEVVSQGQEVENAGAYITYLAIPGGVDGAYDGRGPYSCVWQIDLWAVPTDVLPDPADTLFGAAQLILEHVQTDPSYRIRQMPVFTAPSEDRQGYGRLSFKLLGTHSF